MGWGDGEDEEAGAILKVHEALGIFLFWRVFPLRGVGLGTQSYGSIHLLALTYQVRGNLTVV